MTPELVEQHWQQYLDGNREAIGEVYRAFHQRLMLFCLGKLRDRSLAEDAASETLNKLLTLENPSSIRNVAQWLFTVAKNHCYTHLSTEKRHREIEAGMQPMMATTANPQGEANMRSAELAEMRQRELTDKEARVWELHEQGYANREIGTRLSMQEKTVANHKANARVKLRRLLQQLANE